MMAAVPIPAMARRRREINIYRIAEEGGVSASTVSRVMNRRVGVSEETRARIDKLLRKYQFLPDYPVQRAPKVAFLMPEHSLNDYTRKALNGIFQYIDESHAIEVSIITRPHPNTNTLLQKIRDQQCSGVIILMAEHFNDELDQLGESELPVIFLDTQAVLPNAGFIDNDSYSGSCAAARYLIEQGHRHIGYLYHSDVSLNHRHRFNGYKETLQAAGIVPKESWMSRTPPFEGPGYRGLAGWHTMKQLLARAPEVTAVMAVDDDMALGALTAIHESGLKIPGDISLIGFDNYPETQIWYPALTTVDHPVEQAGYLAAQAISQALANPGDWTPPRQILPTRLIVRQSTGPAPAK